MVLSLDPQQERTRQIYEILKTFKHYRNEDIHSLPKDAGRVMSGMKIYAAETIPNIQLRHIFELAFQYAIPAAYNNVES